MLTIILVPVRVGSTVRRLKMERNGASIWRWLRGWKKMNKKSKIIEMINEEFVNPYPKNIFVWNNKEKLNFNRGRFNKFVHNVVENTKMDIIKIIKRGE